MTIVKETKRKQEEEVDSHGVVEALDNLATCSSMKGERKRISKLYCHFMTSRSSKMKEYLSKLQC